MSSLEEEIGLESRLVMPRGKKEAVGIRSELKYNEWNVFCRKPCLLAPCRACCCHHLAYEIFAFRSCTQAHMRVHARRPLYALTRKFKRGEILFLHYAPTDYPRTLRNRRSLFVILNHQRANYLAHRRSCRCGKQRRMLRRALGRCLRLGG